MINFKRSAFDQLMRVLYFGPMKKYLAAPFLRLCLRSDPALVPMIKRVAQKKYPLKPKE